MEPRSIFFFWLVELAKFCQLHFGLSLEDGVHQELHWCWANPGWSHSLNLSWHVSSWGQALVRHLSGKRTRSPKKVFRYHKLLDSLYLCFHACWRPPLSSHETFKTHIILLVSLLPHIPWSAHQPGLPV